MMMKNCSNFSVWKDWFFDDKDKFSSPLATKETSKYTRISLGIWEKKIERRAFLTYA